MNAGALADHQTKNQRLVERRDLPLCCPRPDDSLWNAHPKVYLPLEENGKVACPYCGMVYKLKTPAP